MVCKLDKNSFLLRLSNNTSYSIIAYDSKAVNFIVALARIMKLESCCIEGRKLLVYVSEKRRYVPETILPGNDRDPIICSLFPADNPDMFIVQVRKIAQAIMLDLINRDGALIHGGLCSYEGSGAVIAGTGGIGKTTSSKRLPPPWTSYSDDATLIIPDGIDGFNAHPWPTWSRFYWGGPGGVWEVEKSLPLEAIFFIRQVKADCLESIDKDQAKAMIIDTLWHITRSKRMKDIEKQYYLNKSIKSADKIASAIPAYRLGISLKGEFWKEMEKVMPKTGTIKTFKKPAYAIKQFQIEDDQGEVHFIYRGLSMNPTFFEPEMLIIEPYNEKEPKKGDIICYRMNYINESIVHRIIDVKGSTIKTRGDNNVCADNYTVDKSAIIGRVVASRKGNENRSIYGGFAGVLDMYWCRGYRKINHYISKLLQASYHYLAASGFFRKLKPINMIFKVAVFQRYSMQYVKLILNGRTVGTYDFLDMTWKINRPYRLFVDEQSLPVFEAPSQI